MQPVDPLPWLLEPTNPSIRYFTLTELLDRPADDPEVVAAREAIMDSDPVRRILDAQWPEGYWVKPGVGYSPRYRATVWQVMFLADLGASLSEPVRRACAYVLDHSRRPEGLFSATKGASGAVICLNGNLLRAMLRLRYDDPRLGESLEALAGAITRHGFHCRSNAPAPRPKLVAHGLPCAWGAIKALGAFAEVPPAERSPALRAAMAQGIDFLLAHDLAQGDYPTATRPSPLWQRFGFPLGYTSDLLEALEVLSRLGQTGDPRLAPALDVVRAKQDEAGRWALEYTPENTWASFGPRGQPSKWVTWRALRVLREFEGHAAISSR